MDRMRPVPKIARQLKVTAHPGKARLADTVAKRHQREAGHGVGIAHHRLGQCAPHHRGPAPPPPNDRAAMLRRDDKRVVVRNQRQHRGIWTFASTGLSLQPRLTPPSSHSQEKSLVEEVDCVVVGAGVVGLAVARALALAGREVIVLEAAEGIGTETSSRNSEVIHAGIYYPAGSLMARFCVAGKRALYRYCQERGIPHANCGKLIAATNAEEDAMLAGIKRRAEMNGVEGMRILAAAEAIELEPNLSCTSALLSPATGIVDSHA